LSAVVSRRSAHFEARGNLIRHTGAADPIRALDDHDLETRLRQLVGRDEAIVAHPDDDDVALRQGATVRRRDRLSAYLDFAGSSIS